MRAGDRERSPDLLRRRVVPRQNLLNESLAGGRQHYALRAAVVRAVMPPHQPARLQAVHQAGYVRAVHDQRPAQLDLRATGALVVKEIEHVELARAEVPAREEIPAGVPQRLGGAQQLEQGLVPWSRRWRTRAHDEMFMTKLFICQQMFCSVAQGMERVQESSQEP